MKSRRARIGWLVGAATLALALPASASGVVTLGSNLATEPDGSTSCGAFPGRGCLAVDNVVPGVNLVAPSDGVIVRWRARLGSGTGAQEIRIRTVRRVDADQFTPTSSGALEEIPAGAGTYTFSARLPIKSGDQVGLESGFATNIEWRVPITGAVAFEFGPSPPDGTATNPPTFTNAAEHTFNLDIEPDADNDGYGDETQDRCPTNPSIQGACPSGGGGGTTDTEAPGVEITKGAPNKLDKSKVKFKFESDDPTASFECRLKGKGVNSKLKQFSACSSPRKYKRLDEGKHKFQVRATDPAGNVGSVAKDKFKVIN